MKKMMILGLVWLTLLSGGQAVPAQSKISLSPIMKATEESKLDPGSDNAQGKLILRYKKSGLPPTDWSFTSFDVVLLRIGKTWTIVGTAGDRKLDITLDEDAKTLKFILGDYVWNFKTDNPKISITTAADRPEILIRINGDFEASGHTGRHYNLMRGSLLAVKAGN